MLLLRWVWIFITEDAVFCRLRFPLELALPFIQRFIMQSIFIMHSRGRNHSLKNIHQTKYEKKWQEEPVAEKTKVPKLLPTIAQNRELSRMQAKELGFNINKFQNTLSKSSSDSSSEELIRNAYYIIKSFSEVDNNFKHLFVDIQSRVKDYLFISQPQLCLEYKIREGCSYKKAIGMIAKHCTEVISQKTKQIRQLEQKLEDIQERYKFQLQSQHIEICELKEEVEKYKKLSNVEYVKSLEAKIEELKEVVSNQEDQYRELARTNEELTLENSKLNDALEDQKFRNADLEAKIYDLSLYKEKIEIYMLKIKDRFEELASRMESIKAIIQKVEAQNQTLVSERVKLVNRAAVTFDDLTPRPKYSNYFAIDPGTNLLPTKQIMQIMVDELPPNKQQFFEKYFVSKKNRKLLQCQAIREKTVQDIELIEKEMSKLL